MFNFFNKSDSAACPEDLPYKCVSYNNFYCSRTEYCDYPRESCKRTPTQNCDDYGNYCEGYYGEDEQKRRNDLLVSLKNLDNL